MRPLSFRPSHAPQRSRCTTHRLGRQLQPDSSLLSLTRAGAFAGLFSSVVYCPIQGVKCVAQAERISSAAALRKLTDDYRRPSGIFRGLLPTLGYAIPAQVLIGALPRSALGVCAFS